MVFTETGKFKSAQGRVLLEQLSVTMPTGKPNVPKQKPGRGSFKAKAVLPLGSRIDRKIRFRLNQKRDKKTLQADRYGFRLMWKHAKAEMKRAKIGPVGSFERDNVHDGVMWGWKHECNMTNLKAKRILYTCCHCGEMTMPMLEAVRKSLSYSFQLVNCGRSDYPKLRILFNWPSVFDVWKTIDKTTLKKVTKETSTLPERIPTYDENKRAFTSGWTPDHPWSRLKFAAGALAAYDCFVCGPRPETDIDRIKKSRDHILVPGEGQMSTGYDGGRAKTAVETPWRLWTVCFCPGKHRSPGKHDHWLINKKTGNPLKPFEWCSTCPLASHQFLQSFPNAKGKRYCKVNAAGTAVLKTNEGDVVKLATDWMISQGVCPANSRYSHNSGRRSLARLLSKCELSYEDGFEIHGDKWQNWSRYQTDSPFSNFDRRQQSTTPDVACKALRAIARKFGRGIQVKPPLDTTQRYIHNFMKMMGRGDLANRIRQGLSDDSDDEEIQPSAIKPEAVEPRPKKRVKPEPAEAQPMVKAPSQNPFGQRLSVQPQIDWASMNYPPLPPAPQMSFMGRRQMPFMGMMPLPPLLQPRRPQMPFMGMMPLPPLPQLINVPPPIMEMPPLTGPAALFGIPPAAPPKRKKRKKTKKKPRSHTSGKQTRLPKKRRKT